jgi:uncharacterized membrane protein
MSRLVPALATALASALVLSPAHASLKLCNRTSYVLYAATGIGSAGDIVVRGWTRIVPGSCTTAVEGDLTARDYYLYARSSAAHTGTPRAWSGQIDLCVRDKEFFLRVPRGYVQCRNSYALSFAAVATHHMRSWTTTFREAPDIASMKSAEDAGLKRLLGDIGVRNTAGGKAMAAALDGFRKRMHLPQNAGADALFSALETEAMTTANPVGYSVCNDTDKPAWAALGQQKGPVFTARGWWTLAAGSCARVIDESVAGRTVYLRVERETGAPLVSGPEKFCVTNIEFDIQGRERCSSRGLVEAGFAATNSGGAPGFTAHVTDKGLAPRQSNTRKM